MTEQVKMPQGATAPKAKKRKIASLDRRKARAGWFFVLPFVIGFIVLYIPILFESLKSSFYIYNIAENTKEFVGWKNYSIALFEEADFVQTLLKGLGEMAFNIDLLAVRCSDPEPEDDRPCRVPCHLLPARCGFHRYDGISDDQLLRRRR